MDTLDEAVEGGRQLTELILGLHRQAPGQVALAFSDVGHGAAHVGERTHQYTNQHAQQQQDERHGGNRGDQRGGAKTGEAGVGRVLVQRDADVPGHRWQALDPAEAEDAGLAVEIDFGIVGVERRRMTGEELTERLHHLGAVRMHQDLAVAAGQEGIAHAVEVQRVDDLHQHLEAEVTTNYAERLTAGLRRGCRGDDQLVGGSVLVGLGQRGAAGGHGILVPGTLSRVVAGWQFEARMHDELAIGAAQVAESESRAQRGLLDQRLHLLAGAVTGDGLRQAFQQDQPAGQPVLDVVRGHLTHLVEVALEIGANGVALQVVVVEGEKREGRDHHQGGGQQDLVAEFEAVGHGSESGTVRAGRASLSRAPPWLSP
nr:hypothetical protein [uncultured bacterium]